MGLMNWDAVKNIKMPSNCRHLCLFILLLSVVISLISAEYQNDGGGGSRGADHFGPPVLQFKTKNNNRDLSEISVRKPQQTPHHHHHHHHNNNHQHNHHQHQSPQQQHQIQLEPPHHLRHQLSHDNAHRSRSNGIHHKQHNHQSNDSAYNRVAHSSKKYAQTNDNNAPASRVGVHWKMPTQQQQQQQLYHLTTMGPFRNRPYSRSWSVPSDKRNWADNLSRSRQAPFENTHSSISRNRTINPYMRSHHSPKHPTTTTTTSTSTTTTSTAAPDMPEKISFDVQSSFNNIDSDMIGDNFDYGFDYSDTYDTKKRSPATGGGGGGGNSDDDIGSFDRDDRRNQRQRSSENLQRDDPVRSSSRHNNGITKSAFKSQHSSNGDNYQLNVNNDGSTNSRPTIETSKSLGNDVKTTNLMTQNIQTRNGILTEEKYQTLGTSDAVKTTFNSHHHRPDPELMRQVNAHIQRVSREGLCRPKLRVIAIPHNPMKTYSPHCTVLHRCSDDIGCCRSDGSTCYPQRIQNVTLPFWVSTKSDHNERPEIELFTFENHTECRCIQKRLLSSNSEPYRIERVSLPNDEPARRLIKNEDPVRRMTERTTTENIITTTPQSVVDCRCPNSFTRMNGSDCKCDCDPKSPSRTMEMCMKLKTGLEHFSIIERRCLSTESCERPTCAYGEYDIKDGRCPRNQDEALTFSSNALNSD